MSHSIALVLALAFGLAMAYLAKIIRDRFTRWLVRVFEALASPREQRDVLPSPAGEPEDG